MICFITFGIYATILPYADWEDNQAAALGQVLIFFSILSSIVLVMEESTSLIYRIMDVILTALLFAPFLLVSYLVLLSRLRLLYSPVFSGGVWL